MNVKTDYGVWLRISPYEQTQQLAGVTGDVDLPARCGMGRVGMQYLGLPFYSARPGLTLRRRCVSSKQWRRRPYSSQRPQSRSGWPTPSRGVDRAAGHVAGWCLRFRLGLSDKTVSHATNGLEVPRFLRLILDVASQSSNEVVDGTLVAMADGYPHPETGQCTMISTAHQVVGIPAFVIHSR